MIEPDQHEPRPSVKRPRADADAEVNLSPIQLFSEWLYAVATGLDKLNRLRLHKLLMMGHDLHHRLQRLRMPLRGIAQGFDSADERGGMAVRQTGSALVADM